MAGVGIAACLLTFAVLGRDALGAGAFEWFMVTLGVLTVGFAIAADRRDHLGAAGPDRGQPGDHLGRGPAA